MYLQLVRLVPGVQEFLVNLLVPKYRHHFVIDENAKESGDRLSYLISVGSSNSRSARCSALALVKDYSWMLVLDTRKLI